MTLSTKYPARSHAQRVAKQLGAEFSDAVYLLTSPTLELYDYCDQTKPFRQDRYFNYLTGAHDLSGAAVTYDVKNDKLTLWLPELDEEDVMWSGLPLNIEQAKEKYDVDDVKYINEKEAVVDFSGRLIGIEEIKHSIEYFTALGSGYTVEKKLQDALDLARSVKDEYEIALMKRASEITDNSHLAVMSALPIEQNEGHIHAEFVYHAMRQGSKFQAYDPICCSGTDCGTLHYIKNDQELGNEKQLVLIDAGAEWQCYAADVTRVFPINGEWTPEARNIYTAVLDMQTQAMNKVKPGQSWDELHLLSHRVLVEKFLEFGIFQNGTVDEILEARTSVAFLPHGLGHMLGMDTHDVAGFPNYEDPDPMFRYLRLRRDLKAGNVVTVEPGIYFNNFLLEPYLKDEKHLKYINKEVLDKYMPVGGVRIEDDVLVTKDGFENLTKITSDPDEVANIVKKGIKKGRSHFHVVV
jgi:Xaa-Pro dipeptidase